MPVLAAASSSVGERERGVVEVNTMMVARFGTLGHARNLATIVVLISIVHPWRSPTPELAAASTGAVRPT